MCLSGRQLMATPLPRHPPRCIRLGVSECTSKHLLRVSSLVLLILLTLTSPHSHYLLACHSRVQCQWQVPWHFVHLCQPSARQ